MSKYKRNFPSSTLGIKGLRCDSVRIKIEILIRCFDPFFNNSSKIAANILCALFIDTSCSDVE